MEKKYTMQEFQKMFEVAELKAMKQIEETIKEAETAADADCTMRMTLMMQSMIFAAEMKKNLFN